MPKEIAGSTEVREYEGTQYRVRVYPHFGYSILHKEYNLTRFYHQKNATLMSVVGEEGMHPLSLAVPVL